jgi:hypothetical protein
MTCDDTRESLSALLDEALTPDERRAVEAHLEGCADCQRELERLRQTVALLHRVTPAHAPVGFVDRVVTAAQPKPWYRRVVSTVFFPLSTKLPVEATALVMVALLAVYTFERTPSLQQAARREAPSSSDQVERQAPLRDERKEKEPAPALRGTPSLALGARSGVQRRDAPVARESKLPAEGAPAASRPPAAPAPAASPAPASPPPAAQSGEAPPMSKTDTPAARSAGPAENVTGAPRSESDARRQALNPAGGSGRMAPAVPGVAAKRAQPSADVVARVSVTDRDAAERDLARLIAQVDGRQTQRRREDDATIVEALIPQSRYAEFSQSLAAIGPWRVEAERPDLPSQVHVILRLQ